LGIPLRVLIVEDSEDDALLLVHTLKRAGYELVFVRVETAEAMDEALAGESWDLIISDYKMPGFSGLAALKLYKEKGLDIPFIVVSGAIGEETAIEAMKAGAHDYVMKGRRARLIPSIERELRESEIRKNKRRADDALKESEQRFRIFFERHQAIMLLVDPDTGAIKDANPAACRFYGYAHDELSRMNIADINRSSPEEITAICMRAKEEEQNYFIFPHRLVTGEVRTVEVYTTPVEVNGQVLLFSIVHDITERKMAEEKLNHVAEEWMTTFDSITDMISILDADYRIVRVNKACAQAMKKSPEELIGMRCYEALHGAAGPIAQCPHRETLKTKRPFSVETFEPRPGVYLEISTSPVFDELGVVTGSVHIAKDITARKLAEEELKESVERYRSLFENAVEGIFQSLPEGGFIAVNPAMAHIHGFASPEEMIESITDVGEEIYVNKTDRDRFLKLLEERGRVEGFETEFYRKDRTSVWASLSARAVKSERGEILRYEGTVEDIASRRAAEKEAEDTMQRLRKSLVGTIQVISSTVETRDPYTAGHQRRVSRLARSIAQEMGLSKETVDCIRMAGSIHDIGKMAIPAEILSKPGRITDIEMSFIRTHPQSGYDILKDAELPYPIAEIVLQHHERLDGSGYPGGLKGDQILREARIVAVADVVEAVASHRPYRPANSIYSALEEIERNRDSLYDAEVVDTCLTLFREKGYEFE
jgi:PAS domain S-box-containing protein/putative nucleotidyltransferase with HDIG domain